MASWGPMKERCSAPPSHEAVGSAQRSSSPTMTIMLDTAAESKEKPRKIVLWLPHARASSVDAPPHSVRMDGSPGSGVVLVYEIGEVARTLPARSNSLMTAGSPSPSTRPSTSPNHAPNPATGSENSIRTASRVELSPAVAFQRTGRSAVVDE